MGALAYADMALAFSLVSHNNLAGAIAKKGADHHRDRYLGAMLDGSTLGAFLLTEPGVAVMQPQLPPRLSPTVTVGCSMAKKHGSPMPPTRACSAFTPKPNPAPEPNALPRSSFGPTSPA